VGDYLLATCLLQASRTNIHRIIEVVAQLGQKLAEGEILQLDNIRNMEFSEKIYFDVIRKKTAALFEACTLVAAVSMNAPEEKVEKMRLLGEYIGLCFQIKDDIFDYFDSPKIGKPTGNDMLEGKLTLPAIHVLNRMGDEKLNQLALKVKNSKATLDEIACLINFTKENGGIEYATSIMEDYKLKALALINDLSDPALKLSLVTYLDYVIVRDK
jgi:octaprenyl-diphosphate synthase